MKRTILFLLIGACSLAYSIGPSDDYVLVWSDEFNYGGLPDSTKWSYDIGGHGWGNNELQFYTSRLENARVEHGSLVIESRQEKWNNRDYTSARVVSRGKADWHYGRIEVRAKLPDGRGTWPAIWMLASKPNMKWPDDGEIDIMEHVGYDQGVIHGTVHTKNYNHIIGTQKSGKIYVQDASTAYHIYHMQWDADSLHIGMDGNDFFHFANDKKGYGSWPFDNKMYLVLNLAVGGNWGGQRGVDENIWPKRLEIDYVRVYQKKSTQSSSK